jgi:hypothetical protein
MRMKGDCSSLGGVGGGCRIRRIVQCIGLATGGNNHKKGGVAYLGWIYAMHLMQELDRLRTPANER